MKPVLPDTLILPPDTRLGRGVSLQLLTLCESFGYKGCLVCGQSQVRSGNLDRIQQGDSGGVDVRVWTRQHPAIRIDEDRDAISDSGRELYSLYQHIGIRNVMLMGVHTNMCILHRSFAIKQMVRWGFTVALVRDLTDTMYNPARPPYVAHAEGTRLTVEFIERFWCPTIESRDLIQACGGQCD